MNIWKWLFGGARKATKTPKPYDESQSRWTTFDVPYGGASRPKNTVPLAGGSDVNVAGITFRLHDGHSFILGLRELAEKGFGVPRLDLVREPDNPVSPASIMVWGILPNGQRFHLGYLPKEIAISISEQWRPEMPLAAELRRYGRLKKGNEVFFSINVLVPKAADRKPFLIKS